MLNIFKKLFSKIEVFEAFTYIYDDGTVAMPEQMTTRVRWLGDIEVRGLSRKERLNLAYKIFQEENKLKEGQVWIYGNYIPRKRKT